MTRAAEVTEVADMANAAKAADIAEVAPAAKVAPETAEPRLSDATTTEPTAPGEETRPRSRKAAMAPRWAFWRGVVVGLTLGVPAVAAATWLVAHHLEAPNVLGFDRSLLFACIFAGLPAMVTGGGVARVAARRSIRYAQESPMRAVTQASMAAARNYAVAGIAHVFLTAIPLGLLSSNRPQWVWWITAGALQGAMVGAVIGLWVGHRPQRPM